ncbi:MAG: putative membrane protein YfcA [Gammaproteobacteria bacterium]|jgi:uncharacterized membrane protein YfcA
MYDLGELVHGPKFDLSLVLPIVVLTLTMAAAGFMRGFVGFGGALVSIPVFSIFFGPLVALPLASVSGLPSTLQLLPTAIKVSEPSFAVPLGLATFVAAPIGTWVLVSVDPQLMKIAISGFVLVMVLIIARGAKQARHVSPAVLVGTGLFMGLAQGVAGVGGPPVVALALARGGTAQRQRANVLAGVTAVSAATMLPLWWHGLFTVDVIIAGIILVPVYSAGTWFGSRYFGREGQRYYRLGALLTLMVIGVITLGFAIRDYIGT